MDNAQRSYRPLTNYNASYQPLNSPTSPPSFFANDSGSIGAVIERELRDAAINQAEFVRKSENAIYSMAAYLTAASRAAGIITSSKIPVLAHKPEDAKPERKETKGKTVKKGRPQRYIYAGKGAQRRKLKLPNNYVYAGSYLGLRMIAEKNHPDDGMPLYKMLDGLLGDGANSVPAKDLPMWAAVMQEEIERLEVSIQEAVAEGKRALETLYKQQRVALIKAKGYFDVQDICNFDVKQGKFSMSKKDVSAFLF